MNDYKQFPSVIEVLSILNSQNLAEWSYQLGLKGIDKDKYLKEAKDKGTELHDYINKYYRHKVVEIDKNNKEMIKLFDNFYKWANSYPHKVVFSEKQFISKMYSYTGIPDLVILNKDDEIEIVEFKTNKNIYLNHFLQVCAYIPLLEEKQYKVKAVNIVALGGSNFKALRIERENERVEEAISLFLALLQIYEYKNKIEEFLNKIK